MNITLINQPTKNRGDESAHRSLVRTILEKEPSIILTVLFFGVDNDTIKQMRVKSEKVKYISVPSHRGISRLFKYSIIYKLEWLLVLFHPFVRKYLGVLKQADKIVNAPGGICMGLFQNWEHVFWLRMARKMKKPLAYYSRSFGPFLTSTKHDRIFKRASIELLQYFDFLSIRDAKTMEIADKLHLRYVSSIDTAFLDIPKIIVTNEIKRITDLEYIVFVPNSLKWQPHYRHIDQCEIDKFYISIIEYLKTDYPEKKIIMLPQLFNRGQYGDNLYFETLKSKCESENVITLPDTFSSDEQQYIISKSDLVIGSRYHSVVFAINNCVPFIALSYEHKMAGMLKILKMEEQLVDLTMIGTKEFNLVKKLEEVQTALKTAKGDIKSQKKAAEIALNCFNEFVCFINS